MSPQIWLLYFGGKKKLSLIPHDLDYFKTHFIGKPMNQGWQPPPVTIHGKSLRLHDFIGWMSKAPVCSEKAKVNLEPVIGSFVEFLPLTELRGKPYYAMNVLKVVDCLDAARSEIDYFDHDPKRIMVINTFAFVPDRVENVPIFRVPQPTSHVFVTRKFIDVVIANKLSGASFADPSINCWNYVFGRTTANTVPGILA